MTITAKMNASGKIVTGITAIRAIARQEATVINTNQMTRAVANPTLSRTVKAGD